MAGETLNITGGNAAGQNIALDQELVIGRSTPGLGSLGGDSEISRVHARVFHDPSGRLIVEDLGSTNGTFVNGQRITGQQALNAGDELRFGQTTMSVAGGAGAGATTVGNIVPPPAAAQPPPPAAIAAAPPTQQLPPQQPYGQPPGGPPPAAPPPPGYAGGPVGGPPQRSSGPNRNLLIALAALVVIALVVAGLAIGGVFGGSDKKSQTTAQTTTTPTPAQTTPSVAMPAPPTTDTTPSPAPGGYPPGFRAKFVDSCASGGAPRSVCACTYDKLKSQYSFTEFVGLLGQVKNGQLPPPIQSAVRQCAQA